MVAPEIVEAVQGYLKALRGHGIAAKFGVVFGSQATGCTHKWSDIDLVVVSPQYDAQRCFEDVALLWRIAAETDARIEPIPCCEKQWVEDDSSAIIEIARREGQAVGA